MISFENLFKKHNGQKIIYHSKELILIDRIAIEKRQKVKIVFKEANSEWRQGVVIETKGTFEVAGKSIKNSVILWYDSAPTEVSLDVNSKNNEIIIYNVWDVGNGTVHYWHNGAAMWVQQIDDDLRLYHCNDGHPDDDLNDLIFTLSVNGFGKKDS